MRKNIVKLSWMRYSPSCTSPFLGFILYFPDRDQLFKKKGKMHVAVAYTKGEIEQAQKPIVPRHTGYYLHGDAPKSVQGRMTHRKVSQAIVDNACILS
jgi:hypothetical protein